MSIASVFYSITTFIYVLVIWLNLSSILYIRSNYRDLMLRGVMYYLCWIGLFISVLYLVLNTDWYLNERSLDLNPFVEALWSIFEICVGLFLTMIPVGIKIFLAWPKDHPPSMPNEYQEDLFDDTGDKNE